MDLHTFLGVIGYGAIALFVIGLVSLPVVLAGQKRRRRAFYEASQRLDRQRQEVDSFMRTGRKIL